MEVQMLQHTAVLVFTVAVVIYSAGALVARGRATPNPVAETHLLMYCALCALVNEWPLV